METVPIGGSGLIGSKLMTRLRKHGHETVAASPNTGVNTLTREGLAEALPDEAVAGVGHHVAPSVVGTDRLADRGYFRAEIAQKKPIVGSSIQYSIAGAMQLFEFIESVAEAASHGDAVRLAPCTSSRWRPTTSPAGWAGSRSARH
jgi:uncharacterized protein YbjT (DUF2867 family)